MENNLKRLKNLKFLSLVETRVTDAGVKDLQVALPTLKVFQSAR